MFKFREDATEQQKAALWAAILEMPAKIKEIVCIQSGTDLALAEGNHHFCANVDFFSEADYKVYATHPAHLEVLNNHIKPLLVPGSRSAVQFRLA